MTLADLALPLASATEDLLFAALLAGIVLALAAAHRTGRPYPVLLVVVGGALAFVPGMPEIELEPELVLVILLPPILYSAAFFSSLRDLRANVRPIALLSIGLVLFTTCAVAAVAHWVAGLAWGPAFVLGAVLSPTDPVAATAIARRVGMPKRIVTVLEGESLVNDSTALVALGVAVTATLTGEFSLPAASADFVVDVVGGVAIGIAVSVAVVALRARLDDAPTEIVVSLVTPYLAFLPAEAAGVSAVVAAVTSGIWLGWRAPRLITPSTRIQAYAVWEVLIFCLNAVLFALVGLQLPAAVEALRESGTLGSFVLEALVVALTVVVVRYVWVFPATYLARLSRRVRERDPLPDPRYTFVVAFTGMRGAVSLAAALSVPLLVSEGGAPFPDRDFIVFATFVTIVVTVLGQALTLPWLVRRLGICEDGADERQEESHARLQAARAALERLDELAQEDWVREDTHERVGGLYRYRVRRFEARFTDDDDGAAQAEIEERSEAYQRLTRELLEAQRAKVVELRNRGDIGDEVMRRIERDLDLEDTRLEV